MDKDNTLEFINVVKRFDAIYNVATPEYKNFEAKGRAWKEVAEEVGLTVDAAKRKWKNLRDSYTKYLRSFRVGTKTSKKYQFWAHADHMDFLKPHQGPGRTTLKLEEPDENDSDIGFQVLKKVTTPEDEDVKPSPPPQPHTVVTSMPTKVHIQPSIILAKNVANGFITQIPTTPLDSGNQSQPASSPIVAKIRAIPTPAPAPAHAPAPVTNSTQIPENIPSPPTKIRKVVPQNGNLENLDVGSLMRANRELDATCLFFLSLAKSVRAMPKRYQAMVKMRCMRIVSDAEVEVESNFECDEGGVFLTKFQNGHPPSNSIAKNTDTMDNGSSDSNSQVLPGQSTGSGNESSEHFLYVMSPSRVEAMIDVSSEDEGTNGTN